MSKSVRKSQRRNRKRTRRKRRENIPNQALVQVQAQNQGRDLDQDPIRMVKKGKPCPPCRKIHHAELSLISKLAISRISLLNFIQSYTLMLMLLSAYIMTFEVKSKKCIF
jgi:hypothetical protein